MQINWIPYSCLRYHTSVECRTSGISKVQNVNPPTYMTHFKNDRELKFAILVPVREEDFVSTILALS